MKSALATAALAAAFFAAAPTATAPAAPVAPVAVSGSVRDSVQQFPGRTAAPDGSDTAWGGACETPLCRPLA
ncbi:hypothetical protein ACIQBJ_08640 [Kitasatospora sp. NPDC088391]|uniref:hypothetical protein n=1 Tax=Kitasatospora sp. NPDC088391 TaxID=3364074 RepID=UPI003829311E